MLRQSVYVVTYITHTWGGAYQYAEKAKRQKKTENIDKVGGNGTGAFAKQVIDIYLARL